MKTHAKNAKHKLDDALKCFIYNFIWHDSLISLKRNIHCTANSHVKIHLKCSIFNVCTHSQTNTQKHTFHTPIHTVAYITYMCFITLYKILFDCVFIRNLLDQIKERNATNQKKSNVVISFCLRIAFNGFRLG